MTGRVAGRRSCRSFAVGAALLAGILVLGACSDEEPDTEPIAEPEPDLTETEPEPEEPEPEPEPEEPEPEPGPTSFLTGEEVDEDVLERPILIVKIDNAPQARPQTGLDIADVVYEVRVEAGITRFLALFHSEIPEDAGPTRSARPADAQIVGGYDRSAFIYSGARPEVQSLLANSAAIRITEGGAGFYRAGGRSAPHNLHNSLPQAMNAVMDREPAILDDVGWEFDEEPPSGESVCPEDDEACEDPGAAVQARISSSVTAGWEYDGDAGVYRRLQNGQAHTVTGEGQIGAANVVYIGARHYLGEPNCYGSRCPETDVTTDGERAIVLRDGNRYEARWRKPSASDQLEILTPDGDPFPLKPGQTWIHLPDTSDLPAPIGD